MMSRAQTYPHSKNNRWVSRWVICQFSKYLVALGQVEELASCYCVGSHLYFGILRSCKVQHSWAGFLFIAAPIYLSF